jgi:hypothetical protein
MKKLILLLLIVCIAAVLLVYLLIPAGLNISSSAVIYIPSGRAYSFIADENKWAGWWPAPVNGTQKPGAYNNYTYSITKKIPGVVEISAMNKDKATTGRITVLAMPGLSSGVEWTCSLNAGYNPVSRVQQYMQARAIKNNMDTLISRLKVFLEKQKNVYGMVIEHLKVKDTVLISVKNVYTNYPTPAEINAMIEKLRSYIKDQGAKEMNYPMLHVQKKDSSHYETMVAISTNRLLPEKGDLLVKRMAPGNILFAEVKGGINTIREGFLQLENYKTDYGISSPAIPFESLVTDRMKEPDTSKWITHLYYPIF